ncbi:MAG: hypothetical protein KC503_44105 [Myxococcales bacterium]|nr:hypothetical protein [Myxococcales bacterium]
MRTSPNVAFVGERLVWALACIAALVLSLSACKNGGSKPAPASSLSAGQPAGSGSGSAAPASKPYTLTVDAPAPGAVGAALVATVKLVPRGGYKVNLEYPTKLIVRAAAAAKPEQTLTSKDAAEFSAKRALFKPGVTLSKAGKHAVKAELKFSVCTASLCELKRETLTWNAEAREGGK